LKIIYSSENSEEIQITRFTGKGRFKVDNTVKDVSVSPIQSQG